MDLAKLVKLKELLVTAKNFNEVWTYFFDHFGNNAEFLKLGERARDPMLEAIITQTMKQTCKITLDLEQAFFTLIPTHGFIHGGFMGDGRMVNVLYFDAISTGSIIVASMSDPNTVMMRFTGQRISMPTEPSMN